MQSRQLNSSARRSVISRLSCGFCALSCPVGHPPTQEPGSPSTEVVQVASGAYVRPRLAAVVFEATVKLGATIVHFPIQDDCATVQKQDSKSNRQTRASPESSPYRTTLAYALRTFHQAGFPRISKVNRRGRSPAAFALRVPVNEPLEATISVPGRVRFGVQCWPY